MKRTTTHKPARSAAGLTLTELLVVIVIIVTLVALIPVGMRSVRQSANLSRCTQNLRTWGIAIQGFSAENNGAVQWNNWASISNDSRYYETFLGGNIERATATMDDKFVLATQLHRRCPGQGWNRVGNGPVGYAMVRPNPKVPNVSTYNLNMATNPSQLLLLMDVATGLNMGGAGDIATMVTPLFTGGTPRHRKMVNALFADGHITAYQRSDLNAGIPQNKAMMERWFNLY